MCTNNEQKVEQTTEQKPAPSWGAVPHKCGYCGSTNPPIPYEQMYGPGAVGWDCCPDCGGV